MNAVPAVGPPLWLLAEVTYRCPLHCVFCYNPLDFAKTERTDELSTTDWLRVLREARALGAVQCGFSGGEPGANGEFSGVAKNSFYVENGKIAGAVTETMINGNLEQVFKNVTAVSKEQVCDGGSVLPWLACSGIVISGK